MSKPGPRNKPVLAITTFSNQAAAEKFAAALVEHELAPCCNIIPGIQSVYRWKGKVQHEAEVLVFIKLTQSQFRKLKTNITKIHPYELPELIQIPITDGLPAYLNWIKNPR